MKDRDIKKRASELYPILTKGKMAMLSRHEINNSLKQEGYILGATEERERLDKVTRVELINSHGRVFVDWEEDNKVELSYQDDGKTLKIFITKRDLTN